MAKDLKPQKGEAYTQVLLEELGTQFKVFGEGLDTVSRQVTELSTDMKDVKQRLERVEDLLKAEIPLIRKQIGELQDSLTAKADKARLEVLEARVDRLERSTAGA